MKGSMADKIERINKGGPPAEERELVCLLCNHRFFSGSFHCPYCLEYGSSVEVTDDIRIELEIMTKRGIRG